MRRLWEQFLGRMPPFHTRWVELWCGGTLLCWAANVVLMAPRFGAQPQWQPVARIGSNCTWAVAAATIGIGLAVGAVGDWRWVRYGFASLSMLLFAALLDGLWISDEPPAGWVLYASWTLSMIPTVMRVLSLRRR